MVAIDNKEAETVAKHIFERWICRFGTPLEFVSDNGREFCNQFTKELFKLLQIKHTTTSPYWPQCNSQAEVANKTIQKYLASFVDKTTLDWPLYMAPLTFAYNTSLHRTIKSTPFFLTYGVDHRAPSFPNPDLQRYYGESTPAQWFHTLQHCRQIAQQHTATAINDMQHQYNRSAHPHNYAQGQMVWLDERNFLGRNRKLSPNWTGPYTILQVFPAGVVELQLPTRKLRVNVGRIKPYTPPVLMQATRTPPNFEATARTRPLRPPAQPARAQPSAALPPRCPCPPIGDFWRPAPGRATLLLSWHTRHRPPRRQHFTASSRPPAATAPARSYARKRCRLTQFSPTRFPLRARAPKHLQRQLLPPLHAIALVRQVNSLATELHNSLQYFTKNPAAHVGPKYHSDSFGLPIPRPGAPYLPHLERRRQFLQSFHRSTATSCSPETQPSPLIQWFTKSVLTYPGRIGRCFYNTNLITSLPTRHCPTAAAAAAAAHRHRNRTNCHNRRHAATRSLNSNRRPSPTPPAPRRRTPPPTRTPPTPQPTTTTPTILKLIHHGGTSPHQYLFTFFALRGAQLLRRPGPGMGATPRRPTRTSTQTWANGSFNSARTSSMCRVRDAAPTAHQPQPQPRPRKPNK